MATVATNSLNGQVSIADTIVQGDTYNELTLTVKDLENTSRDFTGTTATVLLTQCGNTVYQDTGPSLDVSTLGQVSFDLNLPPSVTDTFSTGTIKGEIEYTFPFQVDGEYVVKTCFILRLKVVSDLIA